MISSVEVDHLCAVLAQMAENWRVKQTAESGKNSAAAEIDGGQVRVSGQLSAA